MAAVVEPESSSSQSLTRYLRTAGILASNSLLLEFRWKGGSLGIPSLLQPLPPLGGLLPPLRGAIRLGGMGFLESMYLKQAMRE